MQHETKEDDAKVEQHSEKVKETKEDDTKVEQHSEKLKEFVTIILFVLLGAIILTGGVMGGVKWFDSNFIVPGQVLDINSRTHALIGKLDEEMDLLDIFGDITHLLSLRRRFIYNNGEDLISSFLKDELNAALRVKLGFLPLDDEKNKHRVLSFFSGEFDEPQVSSIRANENGDRDVTPNLQKVALRVQEDIRKKDKEKKILLFSKLIKSESQQINILAEEGKCSLDLVIREDNTEICKVTRDSDLGYGISLDENTFQLIRIRTPYTHRDSSIVQHVSCEIQIRWCEYIE